jgi:hypothetical protein
MGIRDGRLAQRVDFLDSDLAEPHEPLQVIATVALHRWLGADIRIGE